jgi:hypothetical protein
MHLALDLLDGADKSRDTVRVNRVPIIYLEVAQ